MKRLFILPATILLTTVLGSFLSTTFAQISENPQQNSPNSTETETPVEPKQKDSSTPNETQTPLESEQQNSPTLNETETPVEPKQQDSLTPSETQNLEEPEQQNSPIINETETPARSEKKTSPTEDKNKEPETPEAKKGAYVGIQMIILTPEIAQQFNNDPSTNLKVPETKGILIVKVFPNSPAETAGLRRGDIIKEVSGKPTTDAKEVIEIVNNSNVGESLPLTVTRGDKTNSVSVRLGEKPSEEPED